MSKVDGGPAFPHQDSGDTGTRPGMSLRDYFAAKAMQGFNANPEFIEKSFEQVADWSFKQADAMIAARETN